MVLCDMLSLNTQTFGPRTEPSAPWHSDGGADVSAQAGTAPTAVRGRAREITLAATATPPSTEPRRARLLGSVRRICLTLPCTAVGPHEWNFVQGIRTQTAAVHRSRKRGNRLQANATDSSRSAFVHANPVSHLVDAERGLMTGHPHRADQPGAARLRGPPGGVLPAHRLALRQVPVAATGTGETGHDGVAAADLPPGLAQARHLARHQIMGLVPLTVRNRDWTRDARAVPPFGARDGFC